MIRIIFENKRLLKEVDMDKVRDRFNQSEFKNAFNKGKDNFHYGRGRTDVGDTDNLKRIWAKQDIASSVPRDISEPDQAHALNWLISTFIKLDGQPPRNETEKDLELFFQIKSRRKEYLAKKDIYTIKSYDELRQIIEDALPSWTAYNSAQENKGAEKGTNKIYENDDWEVFIPENKDASCKLGDGSEWCTAGRGLNYYFQYHKPDDPLIIFISRKETFKKKIKKYDKETKQEKLVEETFPVKYQFHYGSNQFMDKDDRDIQRTATWFELNSIVANMENPRISDDIKGKASDYSSGFEKLPNGGWKVNGHASVSYFDKDDKLHREDGPAFIEFSDGENPLSELWYIHGKQGRTDDGPARTTYYLNGKPHRQYWYTNGFIGRKDDKPTIIEYDKSGKIIQEEWLNSDGVRHRKDAPALIRADGTKVWYYNGDKHRFDGPALESPDQTAYFWRGNSVSKEKYEKHLYAYKHIPFEESKKRKSLRIIFS